MNTRLLQFIKAENLSQSQFADAIGVARASISHILAGRNKPGFDFIESMARHFPALNLEWLITGKGRMYKDSSLDAGKPDVVPAEIPQAVEYEEDDLFSPANTALNRAEKTAVNPNPATVQSGAPASVLSPASAPSEAHSPAGAAPEQRPAQTPSASAPAAASPTAFPDGAAGLFIAKRSVSKIIVFYDDNTFQELK